MGTDYERGVLAGHWLGAHALPSSNRTRGRGVGGSSMRDQEARWQDGAADICRDQSQSDVTRNQIISNRQATLSFCLLKNLFYGAETKIIPQRTIATVTRLCSQTEVI